MRSPACDDRERHTLGMLSNSSEPPGLLGPGFLLHRKARGSDKDWAAGEGASPPTCLLSPCRHRRQGAGGTLRSREKKPK